MIVRDFSNAAYLFDASPKANRVALTPLGAAFRAYKGVFKVRKLLRRPSKDDAARLWDFVETHLGLPFERDALRWADVGVTSWLSAVPVVGPLVSHRDRLPDEDRGPFTCTELVMRCCEVLGADAGGRALRSYVPSDMTSGSTSTTFSLEAGWYGEETDVNVAVVDGVYRAWLAA
jgi:hypothetical protein